MSAFCTGPCGWSSNLGRSKHLVHLFWQHPEIIATWPNVWRICPVFGFSRPRDVNTLCRTPYYNVWRVISPIKEPFKHFSGRYELSHPLTINLGLLWYITRIIIHFWKKNPYNLRYYLNAVIYKWVKVSIIQLYIYVKLKAKSSPPRKIKFWAVPQQYGDLYASLAYG